MEIVYDTLSTHLSFICTLLSATQEMLVHQHTYFAGHISAFCTYFDLHLHVVM